MPLFASPSLSFTINSSVYYPADRLRAAAAARCAAGALRQGRRARAGGHRLAL